MSESPRRGERGVSILGALVVALMLSAGSIATFELATPSLSSSSVPSESQLAQVIVVKPAGATTAAASSQDSFEKNQDEACKKAIKKSAAAGTPVNTDEVRITKEKGKPAESSSEGTGKKVEKDKTESLVDLCISVQKSKSYSDAGKNKESSYECAGRLARVAIDDKATIHSESKPYALASKGMCKTITCKPDPKLPGKVQCVVGSAAGGYNPRAAASFASSGSGPIKLDEAAFKSDGIGTTLNAQENDALQKALEDAEQNRKTAAETLQQKQKDYEKAIEELAACKKDCDALKTAKTAAEKARDEAAKKYVATQDELDRLKAARVYLSDPNGPPPDKGDGPDKGDTVTCKDGVCKNPKGEIVTPPGANPGPGTSGPGGDSGASNSKGGGMGDIGSLLKSLGSLFNKQQQPQLPCVSDQNQYNQQLQAYQMQLQSYNQQLQQYNYTRQLQSAYGSTGFTPEPPTQPAQPCYKPPQTNSCQQAPAQPDPSQCQSGSWRPTYTGACLSGWQCVPTSGGGLPGPAGTSSSSGNVPNLITATFTCQPQVVDVGMNVSITYSCSSGTSEGGGFDTGGAPSGSATVAISSPPQGTNVATFGLKCSGAGTGATKQCSVQIGKPGIVLIANPKNVKDDKQTAIGWVTSGMKTCVISSDDLPQFTSENANKTNVNGTVQSPPLDAVNGTATSYDFLLHCVTVGGNTKDAALSVTASM